MGENNVQPYIHWGGASFLKEASAQGRNALRLIGSVLVSRVHLRMRRGERISFVARIATPSSRFRCFLVVPFRFIRLPSAQGAGLRSCQDRDQRKGW